MKAMYSPQHQSNDQEPPRSNPVLHGLQKALVLIFNLSARLFLVIYPISSFILRYTIFTSWFYNKVILLLHYILYPLAQERDENLQLLSPPRFLNAFLSYRKTSKIDTTVVEIKQDIIEIQESPRLTEIENKKIKAKRNKMIESDVSVESYPTQRKDINTATIEDLMQIDGLTRARAEEIIKYRMINGPFKSIEEITEVRGIGTKTTFALLARFDVNPLKS